MTFGKLTIAATLALALAFGASGSAQARSHYSFGISTGGWAAPAYYPAPVYVAPPPPPVYYPRYYYPTYPAPYYRTAPSFSFSYHGR